MKIFLDLDGVIVDFIGGVLALHELRAPNIKHEDITSYGCIVRKLGFQSEAEFWDETDTPKFWTELQFTPEAGTLLAFLKTYDVTLLTSPSHKAAGPKQTWIRYSLPEFFKRGKYLIGPDKAAVAGHGKLLIDDSEENCERWVKNGGKAILFPRPWNNLRYKDPLEYVIDEVLEYRRYGR